MPAARPVYSTRYSIGRIASPRTQVKPSIVQKPLAKWIDFLYGPFFRIIGFFYRTYSSNRRRVTNFKANPNIAAILRTMAIAVLIGWLLVWLFASEESRTRLTDDIERSIGGFDSIFDR